MCIRDSSKIAKSFISFGIETVQGYGLTETSPVISAENPQYKKQGSVGIPMKDVQVEIVEKDKDGIGEIRVKGPNVMLGYYENEEATKEVLKNDWFYTCLLYTSPENILKIGEFIDIFHKNVKTNLSIETMKDYIPYAVNFSTENLKTEELPGKDDRAKQTGYWFFYPDKVKTKEIVDELFLNVESEETENTINNINTHNTLTNTNS